MPLEEATKIWRDTQLPEEATSFIQDEDAIIWVDEEILPGVRTFVDTSLHRASRPFTYPIPLPILKTLFPTFPEATVIGIAEGWETQRWNAVKYFALCEIWKLTDTTEEQYRAKGEDFCRLGKRYLDNLIASIGDATIAIPENSTGNKFGLLIFRTPKNKRNPNEYGL